MKTKIQICRVTAIAVAILISCSSLKAQMSKSNNMKKILFVVTNVNVAPNNGAAIGLWLEEFAAPYYFLKDAGIDITLTSPKGGVSPVDLRSSSEKASSIYTKRFLEDTVAQKALYHTLPIKEVNGSDYDAIYYPGGRGPMWDLPENPQSISLIESMYAAGKPIAFVCHGPVALKNAKTSTGTLIMKGRKLAGYTNEEEQAGNTGGGVPYLLEDMLKQSGADYQKGPKFEPFVLKDKTIISGQNPHSSLKVAEELLNSLNAKK